MKDYKVNCKCGNNISPKRLEAGYFICLECGEDEAQVLLEQRKTQCAPLYNKGPYQYIISNNRKHLHAMGRK